MSVFPEHYELIETIEDKDPQLAAELKEGAWLRLLPYLHDWMLFSRQSLVHQLKDQVWLERDADNIDADAERFAIWLLRDAERRILEECSTPAEPDPTRWERPA